MHYALGSVNPVALLPTHASEVSLRANIIIGLERVHYFFTQLFGSTHEHINKNDTNLIWQELVRMKHRVLCKTNVRRYILP